MALVLGTLLVTLPAAARADSACPTPAGMVSQTFAYTGVEQTFLVPQGVSSLNVCAVGAAGGDNTGNGGFAGGQGALVTGTLPVGAAGALNVGQAVYVEVGGVGGQWTYHSAAGGFNGGGSTDETIAGAGGGGASDVRTASSSVGLSPDPRLVVAGGGGGGGLSGAGGAGNSGSNPGDGGAGGGVPSGGGGGTASAGGGSLCFPGGKGAGGQVAGCPGGGAGGGGGGYWGGGAGASGTGGGAGSSFVTPAASAHAFLTPTAQAAEVVLSWTPGPCAVTNNADSGSGSLREAITELDLGECVSPMTFTPGLGTIRLTSGDLPAITQSVTLDAGGATLDGNGTYRGLFLYGLDFATGTTARGITVHISDLTIQNAKAHGGAGGSGGDGGGGAGLGGALFVTNGADVTVDQLTFLNDSAAGGNGGNGLFIAVGGGGLGGNGGGGPGDGGGGGGIGVGADGGAGSPGSAGIILGASAGGGASGGAGGASGGGGGGADDTSSAGGGGGVGGGAGSGGSGGSGGFGGGGGGGSPTGAAGGFGGGGGSYLGSGGFGGGGTYGGSAGFGGGSGGNGGGAGYLGGGGGGMGGAVFVQQGGTLTVTGALGESGGSVAGGQPGANNFNAGPGSAFGSGFFLQGSGGTLTFAPGAGLTQNVSDVIADQAGSGGSGSWGLSKAGAGTLVLRAVNTYSGGTSVSAGTLDVEGTVKTVSLAGGTLEGDGTTGTVTSTGGTVQPGNASPGILHVFSLSLGPSSGLAVRLNGATVGTGYDQLSSSGSVALGGAQLSVSLGFTPSSGQTFAIVQVNFTESVVSGTFAGHPNGSTFLVGGQAFRINYASKSVTLTALGPPTASISTPASGGTYTVGQAVPTVFSCSESANGPGLASCNDSNGKATASGGAGQLDTAAPGPHTYTVTATSQDGATGTASISYTVAGPPTASISSPAGGTFVVGQVVATAFSCAEGLNGPGLASCDDSAGTNTSSGGAGHLDTSVPGLHSYSVTALSLDGQSTSTSISYRVLAQFAGIYVPPHPPIASVSAPTDGGVYTVGQVVPTSFACVEGLFGVGLASCNDDAGASSVSGASGRLDTSSLGAHAYTVTATSIDGLSGTATIHYTVAGAPTALVASPAGGGTYAAGQVVATSFSCSEGSSGPGLASCADSTGTNTPSGGSGRLDTSTPGVHTYKVTAASLDGQSASSAISYTVAGPPLASVSTPAGGGTYSVGQTVPTGFTCSEGASGPGLSSCRDSTGSSGQGSGSSHLDTSSPGPHTYSVTAVSKDGQSASSSISYQVAAAPLVLVVAPQPGATYTVGEDVPAFYACADGAGGPGIASCAGPVPSGQPVDTAKLGPHSFTVTARSLDGQLTTVTSDYTVQLPSNQFTAQPAPRHDGSFVVVVNVPGAGDIEVLVTAWESNVASGATLLQPAKGRFVYARGHAVAGQAGTVRIVITPNQAGQRLLAHHRYKITLRLWVSFTPVGGQQRDIGFYGLHLP